MNTRHRRLLLVFVVVLVGASSTVGFLSWRAAQWPKYSHSTLTFEGAFVGEIATFGVFVESRAGAPRECAHILVCAPWAPANVMLNASQAVSPAQAVGRRSIFVGRNGICRDGEFITSGGSLGQFFILTVSGDVVAIETSEHERRLLRANALSDLPDTSFWRERAAPLLVVDND